jgi:hypothetical protein
MTASALTPAPSDAVGHVSGGKVRKRLVWVGGPSEVVPGPEWDLVASPDREPLVALSVELARPPVRRGGEVDVAVEELDGMPAHRVRTAPRSSDPVPEPVAWVATQ